jgi:putative membrane protein
MNQLVPLALWVGATLCAVLFAYQKLPAPMMGQSTLGIVLGTLAVPAVVVAGQAVLLAVLLQVVMKIEVVSTLRFVPTFVLTALTFLAMLFMLVRLFGSAGKLLAVILLVTQLGAAGSTLPIELATPFFQALHPYLPLSWSVRAIRISMFGAYAGAWIQSIATLGAMLVTAIAVAALAGRWRVVDPEDYQPLLD